MKEKIGIQKWMILLIIIGLIVVVGISAVLRYKHFREEGKLLQKELFRVRTYDSQYIGDPQSMMHVFVFFQNPKRAHDSNFVDCEQVFPVSRMIEPVSGVARRTLYELLLGPTEEEQNEGYQSAIPSGIGLSLRSVYFENGTLVVDMNRPPFMGGSCALAGAVSQIRSTALQFPSVKEMKLYVNGSEEWMNP